MSHRARRSLVLSLTLLSLSLPLAAQPRREGAGEGPRAFLAALWDHFTAPFSALWSADSTGSTGGAPLPQPETTPPPAGDGRAVIDPIGG